MPDDSNLTRPDLLVAPRHESTNGVEETDKRRSFQTIQPLAERLDELSRAAGGPGVEIVAKWGIHDTAPGVAYVLGSAAWRCSSPGK